MEYRRPKVFIDADAFIAGAASTTGAAHLILRLSELGLVEGISSLQVRREIERNLAEKLPTAQAAFHRLADAACRWVGDPTARQLATVRGQADEKDLPVLAAAVAASRDWLITFNTRDFHPAAGGIRVARPGALVNELRRILEELAEP